MRPLLDLDSPTDQCPIIAQCLSEGDQIRDDAGGDAKEGLRESI